MRENPDVIPLPAMRRLWRVKFGDSLDTPKVGSSVLIRGAESIFDAVTRAKKTEGWTAFKGLYKEAEVVGAEYAGMLEN